MSNPLGQLCRQKERQLMKMSIGGFAEGMQDGSIKGVTNPVMGMVFNRGLYQFLIDDKGRLLKAFGMETNQFVFFMENILFKGLDVQ